MANEFARGNTRKELHSHGFSAWFAHVAARAAQLVGSGWVFAAAIASVVVWTLWGPAAHYSDTWQLIANTVTNVVTFLVVFLIQNTQNRDSKAIHLKLDELIRAQHGARNELIDIENLSDTELDQLARRYEHIRRHWEERHRNG
jgi:low affinity Fe/Cu permease